MNAPTDKVDDIITQWQREYGNLPLQAMEVIGRLKRCASLLESLLSASHAQFGLTLGEFDVLATLRRAGTPFTLSPTELYSALMISSGTITHRLKHLENKGLVTRLPNPDDSRSLLVCLSDEGKTLIDKAFLSHLDNENTLLCDIPNEVLDDLNQGLKALLLKWDT